MLGALLLGGAFPVTASAHLGLTEPSSRYGPDVLKDGPCGMEGGTRSRFVVTAEAGSTLTVRFEEYIDHPGHYRVAFDPDGDDDFRDPVCVSHCDERTDPEDPTWAPDDTGTVLMDLIPDGAREVTLEVPLPDVECDNCTLQIIQVMYDKRPYVSGTNDIYYQCVDLVLERSGPPPDAGPPVDAGPRPDAGAVADAGTDAGGVARDGGGGGRDGGAGEDAGGCSAGGAGGAAGAWAVWVGLVAFRQRWR